MDNETFKQIVELATITEKYIKKSFKLFSIRNKEIYNQNLDEIFQNMHNALNKITNYLLEQKQIIIKEIRQLENQKYEILQQYCDNQRKHIMIKDQVLAKTFIDEEEICEQERCLICRTNLYGKITYSLDIVDTSPSIIPSSISKNEELLEINERLNKLYSRYQMFSQVSYNICSLFGHINDYENFSSYNCPRCGMYAIYSCIPTIGGFLEINNSNITVKKNDSILSFLVCNYNFLDEIIYDIPKLLFLTKSRLLAYFCSDIKNIQKNEIILEDDKIDENCENLKKQEQKRLKKTIKDNRK